MTDTALMPRDAEWPSSLAVTRAPQVVLREAHEAAAALKDVIDKKPKKLVFNDQTYLEFEDWQTVGRFYGIAPRIVSTRYVEFGEAKGWEASAEAVHVESGKVISSAESMCLNDEEKWRSKPKYAYVYHKKSGGTSVDDPGKDELIWEQGTDGKRRPKKERMLVGNEAVPLFQLRSMAQTRAGAKALRNALAWVVVLAGYQPTPAEELDAVIREEPRGVAVIEMASTDTITGALVGPAPAPMSAADLFPTPDEELRKLKASILAGFLVLGYQTEKQVDALTKYCGVTLVEDATDPAALSDLLAFLRAEHTKKGGRKSV